MELNQNGEDYTMDDSIPSDAQLNQIIRSLAKSETQYEELVKESRSFPSNLTCKEVREKIEALVKANKSIGTT